MFEFLHIKRNRYLFFYRFKISKINLRRVKKRKNAQFANHSGQNERNNRQSYLK